MRYHASGRGAGWPISVLWLIVVGLVGVGGVGGGAVTAAPPAPGGEKPTLPRNNRIHWQSGDYFLTGVNYPFYGSYGADIATLSSEDSDCNWQDYNAFDYAAIDRDFAEMQAGGVHVVRWFLFGDGRGGNFDNHNYMTSLDATFFAHMDQVLEIAARHNIYLIWSVWDFLMFQQPNWLCPGQARDAALDAAAHLPPGVREHYEAHLRLAMNKNPWDAAGHLKALPARGDAPASGQYCPVYAGGHRNIISDAAPDGAQDHFFRDVLSPLLRRYAGNPYIIGWEAMNEPEWAVSDGTGQNPTQPQPVTLTQMRAFFARFAAQVHADAPGQYATVGSASLKWMGGDPSLGNANLWQGLGLDYYQVHFYGWMENTWNHFSPMSRDYNSDPALVAHLDAPTIVGEFPANGGQPAVYLPLVRRGTGAERSTLRLRALCQNQPQNGPCTVPITATISYYTPAGSIAASQQVVLPPEGMWQADAPNLGGAWTGAARIEATGGVAAVISQTGVLSTSLDALAFAGQERGATTLFVPNVVNLANGHHSRLALQNADVHPATVTLTYYTAAGSVAQTSQVSIAPRGMILIPDLGGALPPVGFSGSARVQSTAPLVAVVEDLDPDTGAAAAPARPDSYVNTEYLPTLRNDGTDAELITVLNGRDAAANVQVRYYNAAGTPLAVAGGDNFTLAPHALTTLNLIARLPVGWNGSAVLTSDQKVFAQVWAGSGSAHMLELYAGRDGGAEFFHYPVVHKVPGGWNSTLTAMNVNATQPVTFNSAAGSPVTQAYVVPPHGQWNLATANVPGLPAGFDGTAQMAWYWPWQTGWSEGFPLVTVGRDRTADSSGSEAANGIVSGLLTWSVTGLTPRTMLERVLANNWAGGLSWSYYEGGTGQWADYLEAQRDFSNAHPGTVNIQPLQPPTATRTPGNAATATAQARTPTPAWGNAATATAAAGSATPGPACCTGAFNDVDPSAYYAPAVQYLNCRGFLNGYPCGGPGEPCPGQYFRPNNNTTRGQFTKILALGRGWPLLDPPTGTFQDVAPGQTFYTYIETAAGRGILAGYPCGGPGEPCVAPGNRPYFRPGNNITRGQLSKLITLGVGWPIQTPVAPAYTFQDVPPASTFFDYVETIVAHGVAGGYPCGGGGEPCVPPNRGYFRPANNGTRGQLSKMLYLALSYP